MSAPLAHSYSTNRGGYSLDSGGILSLDNIDLSKTSGRIDVWGFVTTPGVLGAIFHWYKGVTANMGGEPCADAEGSFPDVLKGNPGMSFICSHAGNNYTSYKKNTANSLNVYFESNILKIQNLTPGAIVLFWDAEIITH